MASGPIIIANNIREARRQGMSRNIREPRWRYLLWLSVLYGWTPRQIRERMTSYSGVTNYLTAFGSI